jgi:hydroxymethylpyrimidine kinase/phosphomethylpyrimidine kinase
MIKGAIFDVDGTLLDSMEIWEDVGVRYLNSIGIEAEPDLGTVLFTMSIQEGAAYVKEHYHLSQEPEEIVQGVLDIISNYYKKTALLKSGAKELLEKLDKHNIPMTVASSNNKKEIEMAFERLGIAKYFDRIFTCEEVGAGKTKPDIYLRAAEYLGTRPEETVVFEDVIHAIRTAKQAGFQVVGIYDETSKDDQEEVRREADWYCREWAELMKKKTALTIAGSDSSGGAGIQADLKTMLANRVYAMSVIAALTAQNTTGVDTIYDVDASFVASQMDSVFTDIYPMAVKIGMVSQKEVILSISGKLKQYHARNIVVDPVMVATSGAKLISDEAIDTLKENLFPLASVLTPNIPEAEVLSGLKINNEEEMLTAAKYIGDHYHCAVLLKGGHQINDANDLLYKEGNYQWFKGKRINNNNTHGTGCTLSSAIASYLARGENLENAVKKAKDYISGALAAMLDLGQGQGPMDHGYVLDKKD